jgi:mono/diheme cytochrome c family protein
MRERGRRSLFVEGWALIAVAVIAFVGGLVAGGVFGSTTTEKVYVSASSNEGEAAEATEEASAPEEGGAAVFASNGCGSCHTFTAAGSTGTTGPDLNEYLAPDDNSAGIEEMIVNPNSEIAEGYTANVMPQTYGQSIPKSELQELVQFLVENSPAGGSQKEGPGGEENDVGGPSN